MSKKELPLLYIAFFEGAAVMAIELGGAKLIAPFYGTSLYVWSSVLAVTLGGLTIGYYSGGQATKRYKPEKLLLFEILIGAIWMLLMPYIALKFMPLTEGLGVKFGGLTSAMMIIMPALVCMGMVSPTIIQLANKKVDDTGKTAGTVYAVSTVGGIFMTLLLGFYALPELGIRLSLWLSAVPLFVFAIIVLQHTFIKKGGIHIGLAFVGLFTLLTSNTYNKPSADFSFLHKSEGILGQVSVMENPIDKTTTYRHMFINHIAQTYVNVDSLSVSKWQYPHRFSAIASIKPRGSRALMIGLGGGSIAQEFLKLGFELDVVELDERIPKLAKRYFALDMPEENIYIDDGRRFIQQTNTVYDIVFIDVLTGENQPHHMFTKEAIATLINILKDDGIIMVNMQGHVTGKKGRGLRSVYKTLVTAGLDVGVFKSSSQGGDLHFYATPTKIDLTKFDINRQNPAGRAMGIGLADCLSQVKIDTVNAEILIDDKPLLELYNAQNNEEWRQTALGAIIKRERDNDYPFFD